MSRFRRRTVLVRVHVACVRYSTGMAKSMWWFIAGSGVDAGMWLVLTHIGLPTVAVIVAVVSFFIGFSFWAWRNELPSFRPTARLPWNVVLLFAYGLSVLIGVAAIAVGSGIVVADDAAEVSELQQQLDDETRLRVTAEVALATVRETAIARPPTPTPDPANPKGMYASRVHSVFPVEDGPFARVIEFGASQANLGGFEVAFQTTKPIKNVRYWWDSPRKPSQGLNALPETVAIGRNVVIEDQRVLLYFVCPTIGPTASIYVYFEADEALSVVTPVHYFDLQQLDPLCH